MAGKSLKTQAAAILREASNLGAKQNYFFRTTFDRYQMQLKIMDELKEQINLCGAVVTKEYVKGRENLYANPAVKEYNNTANAANNTLATLIKILDAFKSENGGESRIKTMFGDLRDDE